MAGTRKISFTGDRITDAKRLGRRMRAARPRTPDQEMKKPLPFVTSSSRGGAPVPGRRFVCDPIRIGLLAGFVALQPLGARPADGGASGRPADHDLTHPIFFTDEDVSSLRRKVKSGRPAVCARTLDRLCGFYLRNLDPAPETGPRSTRPWPPASATTWRNRGCLSRGTPLSRFARSWPAYIRGF